MQSYRHGCEGSDPVALFDACKVPSLLSTFTIKNREYSHYMMASHLGEYCQYLLYQK